jgi:hypothetical protein
MESRITENPENSHYIFCASANWLTYSRQFVQLSPPTSPRCNLSEALFPHFTWGTNRCQETPPPFFIFVFLSVCVEVSSLYEPNVIATYISVGLLQLYKMSVSCFKVTDAVKEYNKPNLIIIIISRT